MKLTNVRLHEKIPYKLAENHNDFFAGKRNHTIMFVNFSLTLIKIEFVFLKGKSVN